MQDMRLYVAICLALPAQNNACHVSCAESLAFPCLASIARLTGEIDRLHALLQFCRSFFHLILDVC